MHTEILEGTVIIQKKIELWAGVTNNTSYWCGYLAGFQHVSIDPQELQAYMCAFKYIRICVRVYIIVYMCVCVCVCMYVYVHIRIYVCTYVHAHGSYRERAGGAIVSLFAPPWEMALFCQVIL
jgi:hypothetical protein